MALVYVFVGGGLGAVSRWLVGLLCKEILPTNFPYGTLIANVIGAIVIGIVYSWLQKDIHLAHLAPLFITGFLGGFTTFSSFSLESYQFLSSGLHLKALLNVFLNLTLCIVGVWLGHLIYKLF